jgi:ribosomal protein S18 acetylase RimI-like enzyme
LKTAKLSLSATTDTAKTAFRELVSREGWNVVSQFIVRLYDEGSVALEFKPGFENTWRLSYITVPMQYRGRGLASRVLKEITTAADQAGIAITLDVDPQDKAGLNKSQLFAWYSRFGFQREPYSMQPNKMSDAMIRPPQKRMESQTFPGLGLTVRPLGGVLYDLSDVLTKASVHVAVESTHITVYNLYVQPHERGQGSGAELLRRVKLYFGRPVLVKEAASAREFWHKMLERGIVDEVNESAIKQFINLFEEDDRAKVSCVMVPIEGEIGQRLVAYAKSIPDEHLYKPETSDEPAGYGREGKPHVTALFGLLTQNPGDIQPLLKEFTEFAMKFDKLTLFKKDDYHVLKIDVESKDLTRLNARLVEDFEHQTDYPDYHPHLTIAYLLPDPKISKLYDGAENFVGQGAASNTVIFSDGQRKHTRLTI